jgi:hypothetical protein
MKSLPLTAFVVALALPALAQDAQPNEGEIDASFTWSSVDIATIPTARDGTVSVSEVRLVVTANRPGLIDRLAGTCLLKGTAHGEAWEATGDCAFADADGDRLFESLTETGNKGRGLFTGGTGKFAGITGEHDYTTTWYSSLDPGENQGVGVKSGHWKRTEM